MTKSYLTSSRKDATYNGWPNYETWNVYLWLDNEQGSQEAWHNRAKEAWAEGEQEAAVRVLAEQLEAHHDHAVDEWLTGKSACCFSDLVLASLREVNWREIAQRLLEEIENEDIDS